jgi:PAS domain S-box-containing protein
MRKDASFASQALSGDDSRAEDGQDIRPIAIGKLQPPEEPTVRAAACVAVAYYLAAELGAALAFPSASVSMLWAPNAILLAALVLAKRKSWWVYLAMVLPAHLLAQLPDVPLRIVAIQYIVNCSTALIGAFALSAFSPDAARFNTLKAAIGLIAFGALLASVSTSILLAAAFLALGVIDSFWVTVFARSLTNAFAILTLVPLIVRAANWIRTGGRPVPAMRAAEGCLLFVTLAAVGIAVFAAPVIGLTDSPAILYAPLPMLLWAAMRFGVVGACGSILLLGSLATWGIVNGMGPFTVLSPPQNAGSLVLYFVALCTPLLLLAAALEERHTLLLAKGPMQARFRTLFARNIVPAIIWRSGGHIVDANDAFYRLTGFEPTDLEGDQIQLPSLSTNTAKWPAESSDARSWMPDSDSQERELVLRDGRKNPVLVQTLPLPGQSNERVSFALDLSPIRRAEEARRRADLLHTAILASIRDQIVVLDATGIIIEANDSWRRFVECAAIRPFESARIGSHYLELCAAAAANGDAVAADLLAAVRDVLEGMSARRRLELAIETADGLLWFEICIEPLRRSEGGAVIIRSDITERKTATLQAGEQRQQLALLGRAAVLGELSGAFAHELNQPLTSILGNAEAALQLLMRDSADLPEIRDILRDIIQDDVRAAEVIQRLRSMLARGEIQRQPVDLNQVVREVLELAHSDLITRGVSVGMQLDPNAARVLADKVQMQQVALNLIVNACEAMSGAAPSERKLTIATQLAGDGSFIECSFTDAGRGIPSGDLERIFQPFVTTKKHGLGLGLAICRSIVEAHGGRLWAEHGPNGGAIFRFTARINA